MITTRPSRIPLLASCSAAQQSPAIRIDGPRLLADTGTCVHDLLEHVIAGEAYDMDVVCASNNVAAESVWPLFGWALRAWRETLSPMMPGAITRRLLSYADSEIQLAGTPDVLAYDGDEARIIDWKTGYATEADYDQQVRAYGFLAIKTHPEPIKQARVTTVYIRDQRADTQIYTAAELDGWMTWLKKHLADSDVYRPGSHCGHCPLALECRAQTTLTHSYALAMLDPQDTFTIDGRDSELLAQSLVLSRAIIKRLESYQSAVKAEVEARGGSWGRLNLKTTFPKEILPARGRELLVEELSDGDLWELLDISTTKLEKAVKAKAPRGQKTKAWDELIERLDRLGAIVRKPRTTLEVLKGDAINGSDSNAIEAGSATAIAAE